MNLEGHYYFTQVRRPYDTSSKVTEFGQQQLHKVMVLTKVHCTVPLPFQGKGLGDGYECGVSSNGVVISDCNIGYHLPNEFGRPIESRHRSGDRLVTVQESQALDNSDSTNLRNLRYL